MSVPTTSPLVQTSASTSNGTLRLPSLAGQYLTSRCLPGAANERLSLTSKVRCFYPQSLWSAQLEGRVDADEMTPRTTYSLPTHKRLEVGKYVADPNNEDFSNPKYSPPSGTSGGAMMPCRASTVTALRPWPRNASSGGGVEEETPRQASLEDDSTTTTGQEPWSTTTDTEAEADGRGKGGSFGAAAAANTACGPRQSQEAGSSDSNGNRGYSRSTVRVAYPVVEPLFSGSAASLFFPVYRSRTAHRLTEQLPVPAQLAAHMSTSQNMHEALGTQDRRHLTLATVEVQKGNLNRMCLYKIGPCAVAFRVVINAFEAAGMQYTPSNSHFNILWAKRATPYTLASLTPYQKVNHFPGTWGIGRKDSLAININRMRRYFGDAAMDIAPASFLLPTQRTELLCDAEHHPGTARNPLVYILKPRASSCGRGIRLCKGVPPMPRAGRQVVCQRYIGNPLLIFGRKFDLRLYCVVTGFDPLRIYLFDEGLVRFAAEKYPGPDQDLDNIHVHLTNYSVNKTAELHHESRGRDYDGDEPVDIKWRLTDLRKYLLEFHPRGAEAWPIIQNECADVVIKTFLSIENDVVERIRAECRDKTGRNCFELFGLDLMVDDTLKVRLIEVNIMPSLATGTPLDGAVKSLMLAHLLTLVRVIPYRRDADLHGGPGNFVPHGAEASSPERVYKFGSHPGLDSTTGGGSKREVALLDRPLLSKFNQPGDSQSMLSTEETLMLIEAEEELHCSGNFRRIFPDPTTVQRYLPYFTHGVRRNTYLLASATLMRSYKQD